MKGRPLFIIHLFIMSASAIKNLFIHNLGLGATRAKARPPTRECDEGLAAAADGLVVLGPPSGALREQSAQQLVLHGRRLREQRRDAQAARPPAVFIGARRRPRLQALGGGALCRSFTGRAGHGVYRAVTAVAVFRVAASY